jgi:alpha-glucosidase (family GH31 glycosyl hydrolase)
MNPLNTERQEKKVYNTDNMITGNNYRLTLLTSRLIRMEYSADGCFEDRATQMVVNRDFEAVQFSAWETENALEISTQHMDVFYNKQPFTSHGLVIKNRSESGGIYGTWRYGDELNENLGGTARTLDEADGEIALEDGVLSRLQGYSVLDDSKSLVLTEDGWIEMRKPGTIDVYFFGYGYAYKDCLRDFFHLCGHTPLLPRYALGNWWSRFHAYSDGEYLKLMEQFQKEEIPLSVAVIDMDWHVTDVRSEDGKGWTGYTWNKKLFPKPEEFMHELHQKRLKVTLNLHPAEGVQPHEEMYEQVAGELGKDISRRQPIPFDIADRDFQNAYFKYLHHPQEEKGVDFWWIDWQQGAVSSVSDLDPLWMLNHYHFQDIGRNGKRPMIFSRYAGPGSHRYPLGFSGDSIISWKSLQFQPYFTATASNIGYGWWSHDIGGHAQGIRDDELMVRWIQFGVFSPIMRLHSTSNMFSGKEPWKYSLEAAKVMTEFMRFRHRMLPYLYSMNRRCHAQDEQLVQPMYYEYPKEDAAYRVPNQYFFGSELIAAPITQPSDNCTLCGWTDVWLPEGVYHDIFTGMIYTGARKIRMYRPLAQLPVLAKAGGILPMMSEAEAKKNGTSLPQKLEIWVYAGADGCFVMNEDDGETMAYQEGAWAETSFRFQWNDGGKSLFTFAARDDSGVIIPEQRQYCIKFWGVQETADITVHKNGRKIEFDAEYNADKNCLSVRFYGVLQHEGAQIVFLKGLQLARNDKSGRLEEVLNRVQGSYNIKQFVYQTVKSKAHLSDIISILQTVDMPREWFEAVCEILCSD